MENNISFIAHEAMMARMERTIKRLTIIIILLIVLLCGTNIAWVYYENQFEDVVTTVEAESESGPAIANNSGEIYYGESKSND